MKGLSYNQYGQRLGSVDDLDNAFLADARRLHDDGVNVHVIAGPGVPAALIAELEQLGVQVIRENIGERALLVEDVHTGVDSTTPSR